MSATPTTEPRIEVTPLRLGVGTEAFVLNPGMIEPLGIGTPRARSRHSWSQLAGDFKDDADFDARMDQVRWERTAEKVGRDHP